MMVTNVVLRRPPAGEARIAIPVQIAPGSDVTRALTLMEEAGTGDSRVRTQAHPPKALLIGFGDYGIKLELGVWVENADVVRTDADKIRSVVNLAILAAFRDGGIELARLPAVPSPGAETGKDA